MSGDERGTACRLLRAAAAGLLKGARCAILLPLLAAPAAAESALAGLSGQWRGSGTVIMQDDQRESIACRASYAVEGDSATQALKCGNPRYVFDLAGTLVQSGSRLSGRWQERRRAMDGKVSGQASGRSLDLSLEGAEFRARLTIVLNGCAHSMHLRPQSDRVRTIAVEFQRTDC